MKERKRYKVIDRYSGPIPLFAREYTITNFPFLCRRFNDAGVKLCAARNGNYLGAWIAIHDFLYYH